MRECGLNEADRPWLLDPVAKVAQAAESSVMIGWNWARSEQGKEYHFLRMLVWLRGRDGRVGKT